MNPFFWWLYCWWCALW